MNAKQLQYAIELYKTRNFLQASEKLNIAQPTLSKQILNLEKELGVKLFDRNTVPFSITPAGEYFIRQAQELLYQEDQIFRELERFKSGEKGRLSIGVSPFRNLYMMPQIIRRFREKYPDVQIVIHETNSDQLRKDAAEGKYDFAIVNLPVDGAPLDIIPLEPESLVLAVPNAMVPMITGEIKGNSIEFSQCGNLPFVVVAQPQEMRRYFDRLCAECNLLPRIAIEVAGGVTTAWSMARSGLGAALLPLQFVSANQFDESLTLFTLRREISIRQPAIVTRQGQYISEYARYAIKLVSEFRTSIE